MQQRIQFARASDGVVIAYRASGQGPPIVVTPPWVSHLDLDLQLLDLLPSFYDQLGTHRTVIRYDERGTGLSDRDVPDVAAAARARDIEAVVDHLRLESVTLLIWFLNSPAGIIYAATHPERVSRLVCYAAFARYIMAPGRDALRRPFLDAPAGAVEAPAPRRPAAPEAASGLQIILFTDMSGSTALTHQLGDARAQELLRVHDAIIRDALRQHGGTKIKHTGDGVMASFGSASGAIECAIAVQKAIAAHNADEPDGAIRVRIGLNAGEPVAEGQDLFGSAVQAAARITAYARPGQILVADVVRQLAAGKGFAFSNRGRVALKGFPHRFRLHEVRWAE